MNTDRRGFLKTTTAAAAGLSLLSTRSLHAAASEKSKIRLGFIGVGLRGQSHLGRALARSDVEVAAICDVQQPMIDLAQQLIAKSGRPQPKVVLEGPYGYRRVLDDETIDAVLIATPWEWHARQCLEAMKAKKYVACEVITGLTVEECWELVQTSESTGTPLMMLENVCYRRDVMAVLNMVRQGLFGELIHLEGGYQHDLRGIKFNDGKLPPGVGAEFGAKGSSEAQWRTEHSIRRNANLYPTHGVGPVAMMADINRGNRFTQLVAYATKSRGLHNYIVQQGGPNHPNAKVRFKLGDIVTTMLKTARDETVVLYHDTNLPRPYSLGFRVQGTKGLWMDVNKGIALDGLTGPTHEWANADTWLAKYDHPLWKKYDKDAVSSAIDGDAHGGMDWFVMNAFVQAVKQGAPTPQDVYDAVTWSVIAPLSEASIQLGGQSVEFPDFTNGQWMYRKNTFAVDDSG